MEIFYALSPPDMHSLPIMSILRQSGAFITVYELTLAHYYH